MARAQPELATVWAPALGPRRCAFHVTHVGATLPLDLRFPICIMGMPQAPTSQVLKGSDGTLRRARHRVSMKMVVVVMVTMKMQDSRGRDYE